MNSESNAAALDSLLSEEAWARRLARALVGDADADDLVQEALLQVTRGRVRAPSSPRAWFATVLRNGAANLARERGRRRVREERVARRERLDETPQLLAAQLEQRRVLAELLLECPEELRTPLMLRHEQGLSWSAIASQLGIGETTATSRTEKGLEWIRARMDTGEGATGGLAGLGVLLIEPRTLVTVQVGAVAGAFLFWKATAAAAVVAIAVGFSWWLSSAPEPNFPAEPVATAALPPLTEIEEAASSDALDAPRRATPAVSSPDVAAAERDMADAAESATSTEILVLLAQLVDEDDRPLADAEFRTSSAVSRSGPNGRIELTTTVPTDSESRSWEAETPDRLHASGKVHGSARGTLDLGTVRLLPSALVRGRLLETHGTPSSLSIGAAPLEPTASVGGTQALRSWTQPEANGRFELRLRSFAAAELWFRDSESESDTAKAGSRFRAPARWRG